MFTRQNLLHHLPSCGLLLLPAVLWNVAFVDHLPPAYAAAEFWRDIPAPLATFENVLRIVVFVLPFAMPLDFSSAAQRRALRIFVLGTLVYFCSWWAVMAWPGSSWSTSALGFTAPAYTPALWLLGISLLGQRLFWGHAYRWWMYLVVSIGFLAAHISHTVLVYARTSP